VNAAGAGVDAGDVEEAGGAMPWKGSRPSTAQAAVRRSLIAQSSRTEASRALVDGAAVQLDAAVAYA